MTKQIFPFYFLLQERASMKLPLLLLALSTLEGGSRAEVWADGWAEREGKGGVLGLSSRAWVTRKTRGE